MIRVIMCDNFECRKISISKSRKVFKCQCKRIKQVKNCNVLYVTDNMEKAQIYLNEVKKRLSEESDFFSFRRKLN